MTVLAVLLALGFGTAGLAGPPVDGERGPERGFVSSVPALDWERALISGNGTLGALVFGQPLDETVVVNRAGLFLPWKEPLPPVAMATHLPEIRTMLADGRYRDAARFANELGQREGYGEKRWTDPLVPAFDIRLHQDAEGKIRDYARSVDFATGVVSVRWRDDRGPFERRLFVSRPDNVVVLEWRGPLPGSLNGRLALADRPGLWPGGGWPLFFKTGVLEAETDARDGLLAFRSRFRNVWPGSIRGCEGAARVVVEGGSASVAGGALTVRGADRVLVLVRCEILREPGGPLLPDLVRALDGVGPDFDALLSRHAPIHGGLFNRVRLDLGGGADRLLTSEELLARAAAGRLSPALLEKEFDAGRYAVISCTGDYYPTLQGIWNGTWLPPWSSDFTQDGNVQAVLSSALSANMAEALLPFFADMERLVPAMRDNARRMFGCRGIVLPSRTSSHGWNNHFDEEWPVEFWTAGAGWNARFFYDYWLYTGDREFLARRAVPFMKEVAAFYEDFLVEGRDGRWLFSPSYSPENAPRNSDSQACVNATMDIAVARELFSNLVAASEELGIEAEGVRRWRRILGRMPDYLVNAEGAVKEWAVPGLEDDYGHRHASHLYPVFEGVPPDIASNPALVRAFERAVELRVAERRRQPGGGVMAFGLVQLGLAATSLRMTETAEEILGRLAANYWYPSLVTHHDPEGIFNVDLCGGQPAVMVKMLLASAPGEVDLLPAKPKSWASGAVEGLPARGRVLVKRLRWNGGEIEATLRSERQQRILLGAPGEIAACAVVRGRASVDKVPGRPDRRSVRLPAGEDVDIFLRLKG
jgi:hypothetical protein